MRKLLFVLALFSAPATAQDINYYARDFPSFYAANPGSEVEKAYNRSIVASDNYAKVRAQRKETVPVIRVEGTIVVQVRVDDGRYRPRCPYNNCR